MSASEYGSGPSTRPGIGDLAYWAALDGTTGYDRVAARSNVDPLPPCLGDRVPSRRAEQIGGPVSFVTDDTSNGRDCFDLEDRTDLDPVWVEETGDGLLSDEELAALALSADPNQEPDPDAAPMKIYPPRVSASCRCPTCPRSWQECQPGGGRPSWCCWLSPSWPSTPPGCA